MGLRERLAKVGLPQTVLTVMGEKLLVKGLTRTRRAEVLASATNAKGKVDSQKVEGLLLSECVFDNDTGEPVYSAAEWQAWGELPAAITGPLFGEVMKLNGLDNDDVGREVKNSEPTGN